MGVAQVRSIDWTKLIGSGILHTKMMVIDGIRTFQIHFEKLIF